MDRIRLIVAVFVIAACFDGVGGAVPSVRADSAGTKVVTSAQVGAYRGSGKLDVATATERIVEGTNRFREENHLPSLTSDKTLAQTASEFANYMASTDRYGHRADGQTPAARIEANGYEYCTFAENIAYFFHSNGYEAKPLAKRSVDSWIASPGHRANMLKPHITEIGVGVAQSEATGVYYAVQVFARPKTAMLTFQVENQSTGSVNYSLGKSDFSLPPRYTRTHMQCVPASLLLETQSGEQTETPANASHYRITDDGDGLKLSVVSKN